MDKVVYKRGGFNLFEIETAYHRNGTSGVPFTATIFMDGDTKMIGIQHADNPLSVAVFNFEELGNGVIEFGKNSFRGDRYAEFLEMCAGRHEE